MVNATTETLTWTGACSVGLAEGEGTLTWNYQRKLFSGMVTTIIFEETGHLQNGRKHGEWVERVQQTEEGNNQPDPSGWVWYRKAPMYLAQNTGNGLSVTGEEIGCEKGPM